MQRLANELLGHIGPVGVGGIDQIDAELDRSTQDTERRVTIGRGTPHPWSGKLHRPESEAVHRERTKSNHS